VYRSPAEKRSGTPPMVSDPGFAFIGESK
jgi:hypothetical protein